MELQESLEGEVVVLVPQGRLNSTTSPRLGARLDQLAAAPNGRLVLDLASVDFISSAGLRVILSAAKQARMARGLLVLCAVQPPVQEIFDISGFTALLSIHPRRENALQELGA
ncbi:Putative anti-sigma factor antagonist BtrV [Pigmentiphaga humi]|uniref:Anti-sigma factor antagonist n=1 Tax=Pigmentiphaga humi TaxID=2478468 RepID=A0A3P4AZM6_9BURK|nr:STAS domain-containing protein [Pigmentiphaga humi]VCU69021.1 Putative anti-sigma factor antagonist BtrV [Pigmentiphaga humi]